MPDTGSICEVEGEMWKRLLRCVGGRGTGLGAGDGNGWWCVGWE